jgi:hypothetical protein
VRGGGSRRSGFDYVGDKSFDIGQKLLHHGWEEVRETAKCEVVCATCHRRRTGRRRGAVRAMLTETEGAAEERATGIEPAL